MIRWIVIGVILMIIFCSNSEAAKVDLIVSNDAGYDVPVPAVGIHEYNVGDPVTAFMTNTIINDDGTTWTCIGYNGSGNLPERGFETSLNFNIIVETELSWLWSGNLELENFEGYTTGTQAMFRQPSFSGGTTGIEAGDFSKVSDLEYNNTLDYLEWPIGVQSYRVFWEWTSSGSGTVRLTTANTAQRPNPMVDFNTGLSFYYLLRGGELDFYLWLRETGGGGPIGADGGTLGTIEATLNPIRLEANIDWQYLHVDIPNEEWNAITGNDVLEGDWGTIESFYFVAVSGDPTVVFDIYFDDIYQGSEQTPYFPTPTPTPIYVVDSIQDAINACDCGGTQIIIPQGVYKENLRLHGKDLILKSVDPTSPPVVARTIIDGGYNAPCMIMEGTETSITKISGLTFVNGQGLNALGGGIEGNGTRAEVQYCIFYNNESNGLTGSGGAINNVDGIITKNKIISNVSSNIGGGISKCDGIIDNNIINGNRAKFGGALAFCNGIIQNNLVIGNDVETQAGWRGYGGGLYSCDGDINHNTIVFNRANIGGGIARCVGFIRNCIIYYNVARQEQSVCPDSNPVFSCVMNFTGGENNIQDDPEFIDWPFGDYKLSAGSPCKGTGEGGSDMGREY